MSQKLILESIGTILAEERSLTDQQFESLNEKLGDTGLLPKVMIARLEAQGQAINAYCDDLLLRKSKVIVSKGNVPFHLRKLDE